MRLRPGTLTSHKVDDVGHIAGLVGKFYVREERAKSDDFLAVVDQFTNQHQVRSGVALRRRIMAPEEWIESPYHAGPFAGDFLWPEKKRVFIEAAQGSVRECIFTGAIGCGKSALLVIVALYDAYRLSCFYQPQDVLGWPATSRLVSVFISMNLSKAKAKLFDPFKMAVDVTPYFQHECPRDRTLDSVVRFQSVNVEYRPGVTGESAIHSEDVIGVYCTEANFLPIVAESARKRGGEALDVAEDLIDNAYRRMESRFLRGGELCFCRVVLDSSRQYSDDFVERRERAAQAGNAKYKTYVWSASQWDAKRGVLNPDGTPIYSGEMFPVEVGVGNRISRLLELEDVPHVKEAGGRVLWCAIEHRKSFEQDVDGSLRDLAGVAVDGLRPLIPERLTLIECIRSVEDGWAEHQCRHPFNGVTTTLRDTVEFISSVLIDPMTSRPWVNPDRMRAVHVDPGVTGDAFGLGVGHISNIVTVNRLTEGRLDLNCMICTAAGRSGTLPCPRCGGTKFMSHFSRRVRCHACHGSGEMMCPACKGSGKHGTPLERPSIYMDLTLQITPPKSGRIQFDDVEALLNRLRAGGFVLAVVTADGHQSEQFLQRQLQMPGTMVATRLSVDLSKDPYYALRDAIIDRDSEGRHRFSMYDYPPLFEELRHLEDRRKQVDHPRKDVGKDVADTCAGVVFSCETREFLRESLVPGAMQVRSFR